MLLVNEIFLLDLVYEAFSYGRLSNLDRKSMDECFKEYLPNLTYEFDALHLTRKQKVKLQDGINRKLNFMKAMEKLKKEQNSGENFNVINLKEK